MKPAPDVEVVVLGTVIPTYRVSDREVVWRWRDSRGTIRVEWRSGMDGAEYWTVKRTLSVSDRRPSAVRADQRVARVFSSSAEGYGGSLEEALAAHAAAEALLRASTRVDAL